MGSATEITTCYKCDTEIVAFVEQVHPLCGGCQADFEYWFERELSMFN